jgi:Flp pilus assembly protein TadD
MATLRFQTGDAAGALEAIDRALAADPFFLEALANAGLIAARSGDLETARRMLARLEELEGAHRWPETRTLRAAMGG